MGKKRGQKKPYQSQKEIPHDMVENWKTAKDLLLHHWEAWGNVGLKTRKPARTSFILAFKKQLEPLLVDPSLYMGVLDRLLDNQRNGRREEKKEEEKQEETPALGLVESSGGRNLSSLDLRCPSKELRED